MTLKEKLIVTAYTGILMVNADQFQLFAEHILGRPVTTHELALKATQDKLKERVTDAFMAICEREDD